MKMRKRKLLLSDKFLGKQRASLCSVQKSILESSKEKTKNVNDNMLKINNNKNTTTQQAFTSSKYFMETSKQCVKSIQS